MSIDIKNLYIEKFNEYKIDEKNFKVENLKQIKPKYIYNLNKRIFDIIFSFLGLLICLIPIGVVSIIIKLDSKGPIFYKQLRLGKNSEPFEIIKFRSMVIDAEKYGAQWASKDDNRVTKIGKILRKSRIDEIPQLFNILVGQMSFVGPRPERPVFYSKFNEYIIGFEQRLLVIPGLTGLAQLNGGYDLKPEEKIIFDIEYIKKRSFLLDLKLIIKTIIVVFNHSGAR